MGINIEELIADETSQLASLNTRKLICEEMINKFNSKAVWLRLKLEPIDLLQEQIREFVEDNILDLLEEYDFNLDALSRDVNDLGKNPSTKCMGFTDCVMDHSDLYKQMMYVQNLKDGFLSDIMKSGEAFLSTIVDKVTSFISGLPKIPFPKASDNDFLNLVRNGIQDILDTLSPIEKFIHDKFRQINDLFAQDNLVQEIKDLKALKDCINQNCKKVYDSSLSECSEDCSKCFRNCVDDECPDLVDISFLDKYVIDYAMNRYSSNSLAEIGVPQESVDKMDRSYSAFTGAMENAVPSSNDKLLGLLKRTL